MAKDREQDPFARLRTALHDRRKALGLSLVDVAELTRVGASKIRRLEQDADSSPRLVHVARLAACYGMSGDEVFALLDLPDGCSAYQTPADGYDSVDVSPA